MTGQGAWEPGDLHWIQLVNTDKTRIPLSLDRGPFLSLFEDRFGGTGGCWLVLSPRWLVTNVESCWLMCSKWIDSTIKGTLGVKSSGRESHPRDEMQISSHLPPLLSVFFLSFLFVFILFSLCFLFGFFCLIALWLWSIKMCSSWASGKLSWLVRAFQTLGGQECWATTRKTYATLLSFSHTHHTESDRPSHGRCSRAVRTLPFLTYAVRPNKGWTALTKPDK